MSTYDLSQLIRLWALEQITIEQAIGQILLHMQALTERVKELESKQRGRGNEATSSAGNPGG